jgi:hypothetical protein
LPNGTVIPVSKRQKALVYSRIVGYMMPVENWNPGKRAEWRDRTTFDTAKLLAERSATKQPDSEALDGQEVQSYGKAFEISA